MPLRLKKLLGFAVLFPAMILYFFAAAAMGEKVPEITLLQALYYLIAGIAWAYPAKFLFQWMNAEPNIAPPGPEQDKN